MTTVGARTDKRVETDQSADLLTIRMAMARYSVSYDFLHDAILDGDLPALRPSREWLVTPDDVMALIRRRTEERAS